MSTDWKRTLQTTHTDKNGRFHFAPVHGKQQYYLEFSHPGFNPVRLKVQMDPESKQTLVVELPVAT